MIYQDKKSTNISQQTNLIGKIEENDREVMLFNAEEQQKTVLKFSLNSVIVTE